MSQQEKLLRSLWPNHCQIVGEEGIRTVLQLEDKGSETLIKTPKGGSKFDISPSLEILVAALVLINTVLEIYNQIKEAKGDKPERQEIYIIVEQNPPPNSLPAPVSSQLESVIDEVLKGDDK